MTLPNNCYCLVLRRVKPRFTLIVVFYFKQNDRHFFIQRLLHFLKSIRLLKNIISPKLPFLNATMGEPSRTQTPDMFTESEPSPKPVDLSLSSIQPAQKPPATPVSRSSQLQKRKKSPKDYENDRVTKYAEYFKNNERRLSLRLSFIGTDLRTRRLAGLKKEVFEELLKTAGIPGKYFFRRSFATWDVLLPTEDIAKKLATSNITTKYYRLQPEYRGQRRIKITVCNVSMELNGDVIATYLSSYGGVEDYTQIKSAHGTAYSDFSFTMILDRGGFNTIPHIISYRDTTMAVIVEGRKPLCWYCKQLGHFSRSCPQKATIATNKTTTTANDTMNTTTETTTTTTTAAKKNINTNSETGVQPDKEGWTLVKGGKKKTSPTKTTETITTITTKIAAAAPATTETPIKKKNQNQPEEMETSYNLKRRRDSGDSDKDGEKKQCTPKPKKQQAQIEKQKPQQPMPIQPQKPTEKIQGPSPIIQNNPQRPAQILHSPAQQIQKHPPSYQFFLLSLQSPLPKCSPDPNQ